MPFSKFVLNDWEDATNLRFLFTVRRAFLLRGLFLVLSLTKVLESRRWCRDNRWSLWQLFYSAAFSRTSVKFRDRTEMSAAAESTKNWTGIWSPGPTTILSWSNKTLKVRNWWINQICHWSNLWRLHLPRIQLTIDQPFSLFKIY